MDKTEKKCFHPGKDVLNETYDSVKFALQKSKCTVCKQIIMSNVERPTIREQQNKYEMEKHEFH